MVQDNGLINFAVNLAGSRPHQASMIQCAALGLIILSMNNCAKKALAFKLNQL